jgi:uncharacterized protein (DUF1330 family)
MRKREYQHLNSSFIKCACGCNESIHSINKLGELARFKTGHNLGKREKSPAWKGGRYIDASGYVLVSSPDHHFSSQIGYVREHRLVMEKHLGRYLANDEEIHHINGIKTDNRIENLKLMKHTEHSIYHLSRRKWVYNRHSKKLQIMRHKIQ